MPAGIRRELLLVALHQRASGARSGNFDCSNAPKMSIVVALKAEVFVDALEAKRLLACKPDMLVHGEDPFLDPKDAPQLNTADGSVALAWSGLDSDTEIMTEANPPGDLNLSSSTQASKVKKAIVSAREVLTAVVCALLYHLIWVLVCLAQVAMGLGRAVAWVAGGVLQLPAGLVGAVAGAAWAALQGVSFAATWPVVSVFKLTSVLVRFVFCALVWNVCIVAKAPIDLVLAVYLAIACVLQGLVRGLVALKLTVFGPRRSHCAVAVAAIEFDPCLDELSAEEICALSHPHRCPYQPVC
jgi:hypothetical protein